MALCDFLKLIDAGWPLSDDQDSALKDSFKKYKANDDKGFAEFK